MSTRTPSWLYAVLLVVASATACNPGEPELQIETEPRAEGAAIWLEGELASDGEAKIEVWAADLGQVFALALHLRFDPDLVEARAPRATEVLGASDGGDALYLATVAPGDVSLGGTRAAPDRGEIELVGPVLVGEFSLSWSRQADATLRIERAQVRRADAGFTPVRVSGAALEVEGGAL